MHLSLEDLKKGQAISVDEALFLSLRLAEQGKGKVEPNPCVGAVLFDEKNNKLVSWGFHEFYGGPHAEVNCLKDIGTAEGLALVVSLEPCSHYGKTPPCTDLVIEKNVSKLIYIEKDPNPLVSGRGLKRINDAGIAVVEAPAKYKELHNKLNDKFLYSFRNKHSYVHLKWGQSKDAKLGFCGERTQVTSKESQLDAHFLRAQSQMLIVGVDTVLRDDPSLNVRLAGYEKELMVGVIDPDLKIINDLDNKNLSKVRPLDKIFFFTFQKSKQNQVIQISETEDGFLDLQDLREKTYSKLGVQSLFVEGGAFTLKQFIQQKVYNRISIYESSKSLGEANTLSVFEGSEFLNEDLVLYDEKTIGLDVFKDYRLK